MADELSRAQLQEQVKAERGRNDALEARLAALENPKPDAATQRRLDEALAELARLKPQASGAPAGAPPKLVPYQGWAQATEDCHVGGAYRRGPMEGATLPNGMPGPKIPGDHFQIDVAALWTDDPYVAVHVRMSEETNTPIVTRNTEAPARIDFRFRAKGMAETQIAPLRANQF